jgi:hypothetical protein
LLAEQMRTCALLLTLMFVACTSALDTMRVGLAGTWRAADGRTLTLRAGGRYESATSSGCWDRRRTAHFFFAKSAMAAAIDTNSLGIMTIVIVFCSAPTSVIICIRRSSRPAGLCMIVSAA